MTAYDRDVRLSEDDLYALSRILAREARVERKRALGYVKRGTTHVKPGMYERARDSADQAERLAVLFDTAYRAVVRLRAADTRERLGLPALPKED